MLWLIKFLLSLFSRPSTPAKTVPTAPAGSPPSTLGITCVSTIFGRDYDGSIDKGDNGEGYFTDPKTGKPYNTRDKSLVGVSLPIPFFQKTPHLSRHDIESGAATVTVLYLGHYYTDLKIVDVGPGEDGKLIRGSDGPRLLDRSYGLCQLMKSNDNAELTYWIVKGGVYYDVQGQDTPYKVI